MVWLTVKGLVHFEQVLQHIERIAQRLPLAILIGQCEFLNAGVDRLFRLFNSTPQLRCINFENGSLIQVVSMRFGGSSRSCGAHEGLGFEGSTFLISYAGIA